MHSRRVEMVDRIHELRSGARLAVCKLQECLTASPGACMAPTPPTTPAVARERVRVADRMLRDARAHSDTVRREQREQGTVWFSWPFWREFKRNAEISNAIDGEFAARQHARRCKNDAVWSDLYCGALDSRLVVDDHLRHAINTMQGLDVEMQQLESEFVPRKSPKADALLAELEKERGKQAELRARLNAASRERHRLLMRPGNPGDRARAYLPREGVPAKLASVERELQETKAGIVAANERARRAVAEARTYKSQLAETQTSLDAARRQAQVCGSESCNVLQGPQKMREYLAAKVKLELNEFFRAHGDAKRKVHGLLRQWHPDRGSERVMAGLANDITAQLNDRLRR